LPQEPCLNADLPGEACRVQFTTDTWASSWSGC